MMRIWLFQLLLLPTFFGDLIIDQFLITYGSWQEEGYLSVVDTTTSDFLFEHSFQLGDKTDFVFLADVGNHQFIALALVDEDAYWLVLFDVDGHEIDRKCLDYSPNSYYNHHFFLVLEYENQMIYYDQNLDGIMDVSDVIVTSSYTCQSQGDILLNGIKVNDCVINTPGIYDVSYHEHQDRFDYRVIIKDELMMIENFTNQGKIHEVYIRTYGDIFINDVLYHEEVFLSQPGKYAMLVYYQDFLVHQEDIIILPLVTYYNGLDVFTLQNDQTIHEPMIIHSNASAMMLNGMEYKGEYISITNDYELVLFVEDERMDVIHFSIEPKVSGLKHDQVYQSVTFYAFGDVYLNQEKIEGLQKVDRPGDYFVEVYMKGVLVDRIHFFIKHENKENSLDDLSHFLLYGLVIYGLIKFSKK